MASLADIISSQVSPKDTVKMPSRQIVAPLPISPSQHKLKLGTQDFYSSINATLASKADRRPSTPHQGDYSVPAPPPPSPVSFRPDNWPTSTRC